MRVTALGLFAAGFMLLLGAAAAVVAAQITTKALAAWISMGYSAGACACTVAALVIAPGDTVFVQAATADSLVLWEGRKLAGVVGVTYHEGEPMPQPDDVPVLCVQTPPKAAPDNP